MPFDEDGTFYVEHSGQHWRSLGRGPNGRPLWPIEEYLARRKHTPRVAARIRRLNPGGFEEGSYVRGLFYEPMSWRRAKRLGVTYAKLYYVRRRGQRGRPTILY